MRTRRARTSYPNRPVRIVANFAVGGAIDVVARVVGAKVAESMGQQFVVENRPGAGGNIGADAVAKAKPDGYTLLCTLDTTLTVNPSLYGKLPFDPAQDFEPITLAAAAPLVLLTHPALPAPDLKAFVALAKARGGSAEIRLRRERERGASRRSAARPGRGDRIPARAVQGRAAGGDRPRRRAD